MSNPLGNEIDDLRQQLAEAKEKYRLLSAQHARLCDTVYEEDGETLKIVEVNSIIEETKTMLHKDAKANMPTLPSAVAWCRNEIDMLAQRMATYDAIINYDGSLKSFEDRVTVLQDMAAAYAHSSEWEALEQQLAACKQESALRWHQVLTCGVAATHPNPRFTLTGVYWDKWNSAQATAVRALRADRDALQQQLARHEATIEAGVRENASLRVRLDAALAGAVAVQAFCASRVEYHARSDSSVTHSAFNHLLAAAAELRTLDLDPIHAGRELLEPLRRDAKRYKWLADKVLACDYGDNDTQGGSIGWRIRHCKGPSMIYGASIDAAIDAAIAAGGDKT